MAIVIAITQRKRLWHIRTRTKKWYLQWALEIWVHWSDKQILLVNNNKNLVTLFEGLVFVKQDFKGRQETEAVSSWLLNQFVYLPIC